MHNTKKDDAERRDIVQELKVGTLARDRLADRATDK